MKRPWNLPNVPVYSLATYAGRHLNMNICTYVSAVSMKPKRYMVAIYQGTLTLANLGNENTVVLQLLGIDHLSLVNVLGKRSGSDFDKGAYLQKKQMLYQWNERTVLKNCAALLELEKISHASAGDHMLFVFDVKRFTTNHQSILMLDDLRKNKLIRI